MDPNVFPTIYDKEREREAFTLRQLLGNAQAATMIGNLQDQQRERADLETTQQALRDAAGDPMRASQALMATNPMAAIKLRQMAAPKVDYKNVPGVGLVKIGENGPEVAIAEKEKQPIPAIVQNMRAAGIDPQSPEGQKYLRDYLAKQTTHAPAPSATVVNAPGEPEYTKERSKGMAKEMTDLEAKVPQTVGLISSASRIKELSAAGTFQGALAPGAVGAEQFLSSFGINIAPEKLKNTRELQAVINQLTLDTMAASGGARGFTEKETAILVDSFPKIQDSPEARQAIADVLINKSKQGLKSYVVRRQREIRDYGTAGAIGDQTYLNAATEALGWPSMGAVKNGYEYIGGDPSQQAAWKKK